MVSELLALGSPTRPLLFAPMLVYNVLVFPFAAGVWASAEGRRARRLTAVALAGYGVFSSGALLLGSMEVRSAGLSEQTVLHIWATAGQGLCMAAVLVGGAFAHGARFRRYSLATLAVLLIAGALASYAAAQESMPWIGLTERVNIYGWMLWLAVLAISLLPSDAPIAPAPLGAARRDDVRLPLRGI